MNELTLPDTIPAYLQVMDPTGNDEFTDGLSTGWYPEIRTHGTRFKVHENGEDTALAVLELPIVILRAQPGVRKKWYATAYDPNSTDARPPNCQSVDGITPDASVLNPQHQNCAGCPQNAFGSGKDQNGNPSKGKACADIKHLAVFSAAPKAAGIESTIFGFGVPPGSLTNFATYVKGLTGRRVKVHGALTLVSFDPKVSKPILQFKLGGVLNEQQVQMMEDMQTSEEVLKIIEAKPSAPRAEPAPQVQAQAAPPPAAEPAKQPATNVVDLGLPAAKAAPAQQAAPAPASDPLADLGLPASPAKAAPAPAQQVASGPSDDELARQLGLM